MYKVYRAKHNIDRSTPPHISLCIPLTSFSLFFPLSTFFPRLYSQLEEAAKGMMAMRGATGAPIWSKIVHLRI